MCCARLQVSQTVNDEMQSRNTELQQINNDLLNLLSSVNIPILMLSGDWRIRRFTPQAEKLLNLLPGDVGRPIGHVRPNIEIPDLAGLVSEVLDTVSVREREVQRVSARVLLDGDQRRHARAFGVLPADEVPWSLRRHERVGGQIQI